MGKATRKLVEAMRRAVGLGPSVSVVVDGQRWMRVGLTDVGLAGRLMFYSGYFEEEFPDRPQIAGLSADLKAAARIVSNGRHD